MADYSKVRVHPPRHAGDATVQPELQTHLPSPQVPVHRHGTSRRRTTRKSRYFLPAHVLSFWRQLVLSLRENENQTIPKMTKYGHVYWRRVRVVTSLAEPVCRPQNVALGAAFGRHTTPSATARATKHPTKGRANPRTSRSLNFPRSRLRGCPVIQVKDGEEIKGAESRL